MQQAILGLERSPFSTGHDVDYFYNGPDQQEALARVRFLVDHGHRLGLLQGEAGVGKSFVLKVLRQECRQRGKACASINLLGVSVHEFYWLMAVELQATPKTSDDTFRLLRRVEDRICENKIEGVSTVLLLDDVDQAGPDVQTQLLRFALSPTANSGGMTLVITANPRNAARLGKRLLELVDLRIDLAPWEETDTIGCVQHALVAAGAERPFFEEAALKEIHRLTGGIPRKVNRLAEYSLLAGSSAGGELIDALTVRQTHESIHLGLQ